MGLIKVTDATVEPLTLAEAKAHLREDADVTAGDVGITALIQVARIAAEDRIGRSLLQTVWRLTLDAFPCQHRVRLQSYRHPLAAGHPLAIELPRSPVLSVDSVKYVDVNGVQQTLAPTDYSVDLSSEPARIVPAYGKVWPATRAQIASVEVQFSAGYGTTADKVPPPIRHWIKLALTDLHQLRGRSSDKPAVPQGFADHLLDPHKIWSL